MCYICLYVDDIPGGHNNAKWYRKFISDMKKDFNVGEVGPLDWVMQVEVKKIANGFQFCHKKYINDLLRKFGMENCKAHKVPLDPAFEISSSDSPTNDSDKQVMANKGYKELVGALLWIARISRPDIQVAVSILCRFAANPSERHLTALRGILAYLSGTKELGVCFTKTDKSLFKLIAYSDADWAGDKDTRHSTSGNILYMGTTPICWYAGKQGMVSTSTTEAEYIAYHLPQKKYVTCETYLNQLDFLKILPPCTVTTRVLYFLATILKRLVDQSTLLSSFITYVS
jgi:hypothetical protein